MKILWAIYIAMGIVFINKYEKKHKNCETDNAKKHAKIKVIRDYQLVY